MKVKAATLNTVQTIFSVLALGAGAFALSAQRNEDNENMKNEIAKQVSLQINKNNEDK